MRNVEKYDMKDFADSSVNLPYSHHGHAKELISNRLL